MKKLQIMTFLLVIFSAFSVKADLSESSLVPKDEMNFAKDYLGKLREKNFDYVLSYIDPEISDQVTIEKIEEVANYFPSGKLLSTELIGSQVNTHNSTWLGNFSFEYEFDSGWAVANTVMKRIDNNKTTIVGFNVYRTKASQKELNKFVLSGKSLLHYLVLALSCAVPIFIIITLIYCIKTPIQKRKWLWVLFVLGGIGTITVNWSTGFYEFKILQYLLFGASATAAGEHAPWVLAAGIPLGAIVFWFKRNSFIEQAKANQAFKRTP
jgi:hypothetical protein